MLKIASWNINSVRLRSELVKEYLLEDNPDILCLQEIKTENQFFPYDFFRALGYDNLYVNGQKSYNGVAVLSKIALQDENIDYFTSDDGARQIAVKIPEHNILLRNLYIPAGGDDADEVINPKFHHKMNFLRFMRDNLCKTPAKNEIIVGDFNIAPHEHDVWSHKQLLKVVSHTPIETEILGEIKERGNFCDIFRDFSDETQKLYSWWSYRGKNWEQSDKGRRLDHIWCSMDLKHTVKEFHSFKPYRGKTQPSDHVPICVVFAL